MYEQMHRLLIRGAELVVREYAPAAESRTVPAQRTVLLLHGVCEHGGRYGEFATAAVLRGWRVLVPDLRGHGISGGIRTHITDVQEYLADAESILQQLVRQDALLTVVGHSFGGLLAALWILQEPLRFRAGVMLSPAMGVNVPISLGKWVAGKLLSLVWPTFRFKTGIKGADLSHDEEYLARRRADTLIIRSVTCGWFFAMQRGVERAWEASARCQIPLLVLQGSAEAQTPS